MSSQIETHQNLLDSYKDSFLELSHVLLRFNARPTVQNLNRQMRRCCCIILIAYMKCHQDNVCRANLSRSWGPAQISGACLKGELCGAAWRTHGKGVSLITGSQKPSQRARGMGAVPRVTHLVGSIRAGLCSDVISWSILHDQPSSCVHAGQCTQEHHVVVLLTLCWISGQFIPPISFLRRFVWITGFFPLFSLLWGQNSVALLSFIVQSQKSRSSI